MRKISLLLALIAGLLAGPAQAANFSAKDAAAATIIFTNPGNCTTGCTPIFSWFDSTGVNAVAVLTAGADGASNSANGGLTYGRNLVFNGTTWDRWTGLVTAAQSGTWNITNISGTVSLPTGAATSAAQATGNASLSSIDGKTPALGQALAAASVPVILPAATITTLTPPTTVTANLGTLNGAATAAKQPAIGTAGVASADILTVQGIASMTPLLATVTGTVTANQGGTWNITNISGTVSLPTLASTSTKQSDGSQKTQIVDGIGNVIASTSNNLNVQCANCSGSGVSTADEATMTPGASLFAGSGGFFQTTATSNALTTGQQGMFQVTANRALFTNLRNAAGTEIATAGTPLQVSLANTATNATAVKVDGSAVTQPVSGTVTTTPPANASTNVAQINGVTPLMGNGVTGTGSQRVTIASDNTAFAVNAAATLNAETTKVIGTVRNVGNAGGIFDAIGQNVAAPANWMQMGCQFNTSPTTITTTNGSPCQMDNAGNIKVNIAAGASSGAVAQGSTTSGQTGGLTQAAVTTAAPTYTTAQTSPLSLTTAGELRTFDSQVLAAVNAATPAGTNIIGKVGIDQTTPGTTNGVQVNAALPAGTNVIGHVIADTGSTTAVTALPAIPTGTNIIGSVKLMDTAGTNVGTIKAASTAPVATDTSLVTALNPNSPGIIALGATTKSASVPTTPPTDIGTTPIGSLSSQYPSNSSAAAVPITASATGTTAATTATLAAAVGKTTYICGFSMRSVATAAAAGNATVTGTITGTLNFTHGTGATPTVIPNDQRFNPCIPASATNTSIAVVSPAAGTGGVMSVTAWGFQL